MKQLPIDQTYTQDILFRLLATPSPSGYTDRAVHLIADELDKLGRMARLAGIAIKRQIDEERLRSSEARYRGLFENVVDGVYIASRDGEIITVNPALVEMLGYDDVEDLKAAETAKADASATDVDFAQFLFNSLNKIRTAFTEEASLFPNFNLLVEQFF